MKKFSEYLEKNVRVIKESYSSAEEAIMDFNYGLEELDEAIKKIKSPESYIEKYYKTTTPKIIKLMSGSN